MKKQIRIVLALVTGFGISCLVFSIMIYLGYRSAYMHGGAVCEVRFLGLSIYRLYLQNGRYRGESIGRNMGIVSAVFMAAAVFVEEIVHKSKSNRRLTN